MRSILFSLLTLLALSFGGAVFAAIDINSANEAQFETLPGIGPGKAKEIVADRNTNGPFRSIDDLGRVRGIGDKTLAGLRDHITVSANPAPSTNAPAGEARQTAAPAALEKRFPWIIIIVVAVAGGGIAWFLFRRRAAEASTEAPRAGFPEHTAAATTSAPTSGNVGPAGAGVAATRTLGGSAAPPPAPAGPKPAGHTGQASSSGGAPGHPAPAGMRPAGMPPAPSKPAGTGAPPAPAGSKPK